MWGVSAWRRQALEAFPELQTELNDAGEIFSVYALWFELLSLVEDAHRTHNEEMLRRIYGYADWCRQQSDELGNAVAVAFYEHLFDEPWMRPLVVPWLSPRIISDIRPLWVAQLAPDDMKEVERLLQP